MPRYSTTAFPAAASRRLALVLSLGAMSFGLMGIGCCDCASEGITGSYALRFNPDSTTAQGFRRREIQSAYLLAYAAPDFSGRPDTLRQPRPANTLVGAGVFPVDADGRFFLNTFLLMSSGVPARSFRVVVPAAQRQFALRDFAEGAKESSGPCNCQSVQRKTLTLDGTPVDILTLAGPVVLNR